MILLEKPTPSSENLNPFQPTSGIKSVMLFDIGKPRSKEFLDYFEENLRQKGLVPKRAAKPTNAKTATQEVIDFMVKEADVVIGALSD